MNLTNDFTALDAQTAEGSLAQIWPEEFYSAEEQPDVTEELNPITGE